MSQTLCPPMQIGERISNIEGLSRSQGHKLRNKGWKFCKEMIVNSDRVKVKRSETTNLFDFELYITTIECLNDICINSLIIFETIFRNGLLEFPTIDTESTAERLQMQLRISKHICQHSRSHQTLKTHHFNR